MQKIKVMHITYDMRIGGTEQVIKNLVEGNHDPDIEMSIFCLEQPLGPFGEMLVAQGTKITSVNRRQGFDTSLIKKIRAHIRSHEINVLHCHQYTPWVYGTLASIATGTNVIFTEHGRFYPDSSSWKRRYINPVLARLSDHITSISSATRQALIDYEYLDGDNIQVIYNGIHPLRVEPQQAIALKQQLGLPETTPIIGTVARFDPIKNHRMLFDAFAQVLKKHPQTVLMMIGDGEERHNLEAQANSLGITENILFTGYVSEPAVHIACMDIFLLPSLSEGTSMTLLEAMSLGKPCVVTDAGGNPEIIEHDTNGIVTPNDDAEYYARAVEALLDDTDRRNRMGATSFERFETLFHVKKMSAAYNHIYHRT